VTKKKRSEGGKEGQSQKERREKPPGTKKIVRSLLKGARWDVSKYPPEGSKAEKRSKRTDKEAPRREIAWRLLLTQQEIFPDPRMMKRTEGGEGMENQNLCGRNGSTKGMAVKKSLVDRTPLVGRTKRIQRLSGTRKKIGKNARRQNGTSLLVREKTLRSWTQR